MLSKIPTDLDKLEQEDIDREILRFGIMAELDAVNLYEQLASKAENNAVKAVLKDIAREEKTHIGEFETLLVSLDKEQAEETEKGKKEVEEEILGNEQEQEQE